MRPFGTHGLLRISESYRGMLREGDGVASSIDQSDPETVRRAFFGAPSDDATRTVMVPPSKEFMEAAYRMLNEEFFGGVLPSVLQMKTASLDVHTGGMASCIRDTARRQVNATAITLNSAWTATLRDWMGVMVHECIHVLDYATRPDKWLDSVDGRGVSHYDSHGEWFMSAARRFDKYGFDIGKYAMMDKGFNADDPRMASKLRRTASGMLVARIVGVLGDHGGAAFKIARSSKGRFEETVERRIQMGAAFLNGISKIEYYTTDNPKFVSVKTSAMREGHLPPRCYYFDNLERNYGPFVHDSDYVPTSRRGVAKTPTLIERMAADTRFRKSVERWLLYVALVMRTFDKRLRTAAWGIGRGIAAIDYYPSLLNRNDDLILSIVDGSRLYEIQHIVDSFLPTIDYVYGGYGKLSPGELRTRLDDAIDFIERDPEDAAHVEKAKSIISEEMDRLLERFGKPAKRDAASEVNEDADETPAEDCNLLDDAYARDGWIPFRNTLTKAIDDDRAIVMTS